MVPPPGTSFLLGNLSGAVAFSCSFEAWNRNVKRIIQLHRGMRFYIVSRAKLRTSYQMQVEFELQVLS